MLSESLVVERNNKLLALIYPDYEEADSQNLVKSQLEEIFASHIKLLNTRLPGYMNLSAFHIHGEEFEKTPKRSIKRFLYQY